MRYTLIIVENNVEREVGTFLNLSSLLASFENASHSFWSKLVSQDDEFIREAYIIVKPNEAHSTWYGLQLETFLYRCDDRGRKLPWIGQKMNNV